MVAVGKGFVSIVIPAVVACSAIAQSIQPALRGLFPADATVVETQVLPSASAGKTRMLVLWMINPKKDVRQGRSAYCGDSVYGDSWVGPTRLSVVDLNKRKVLDTIPIVEPAFVSDAGDSFRLPFLVTSDYYHVPRVNLQKEGKPQLLFLRDFTGDGIAAEFVLFAYEACSIVSTSVFGYESESDYVVQYPIEVIEDNGNPTFDDDDHWISQIFAEAPTTPGSWDFSWSPGHGADEQIHERVSFDKLRKRFVDHRTITKIPLAVK